MPLLRKNHRLKTHFPENTGSEANIIALLDALESEHADSEELKPLRAIKSDHSRLAAEHTELQQAAQLQHERTTARIAELERMDTEHTLQIAKMNGYISHLENVLEHHGIVLPKGYEFVMNNPPLPLAPNEDK